MEQHLQSRFRALKAGSLYYLLIFGLGFILGIIRNLYLIPRTGELMGVIIELPVMLSASYVVSGMLVKKFKLTSNREAWIMGLTGFALLMLSEIILGMIMGQAFNLTLPGLLGLLGQCYFGILPRIRIGKLK